MTFSDLFSFHQLIALCQKKIVYKGIHIEDEINFHEGGYNDHSSEMFSTSFDKEWIAL